MPYYKYLIVGGGMTADAAAKGIRQIDKAGRIGVVTSENHPPYNRPPLSKGLWKGEALQKIWRETPTDNLEIHLARTIGRIDPKEKVAVDHEGIRYSFDKLLLATGGSVRRLPFAPPGILYFRTLDDYHRLREITAQGKRVAVIGGGFIGSEVAASLAMNGVSVTMIFPEEGIGARVYPPGLSVYLNTFYRSKGVEILATEGVTRIEERNSKYLLKTIKGNELEFEAVVAGIGIVPNVELAQTLGLKIENGIVVDQHTRTSHPDIFAAGDNANFYNPALGKRVRLEHEDNANVMGETAGKNMAGGNVPYDHLPFFYSDLFELGYEAVGELDPRLETIEHWNQQYREGVVYYLNEGRVRGVLLWNVWGQVDAARQLIAESGPFTKESLKEYLPA